MKKKFYAIIAFTLLFLNVISVNAAMFYEEPLNSVAIYVVDKSSGIPIVEKNIHERRSPASLTKMMTFIIAFENCDDAERTKVIVKKEVLDLVDPESSGVKLKDGEEITLQNLFNCMLICSSGDAAMVIADYIGGGSIENFVNKMNEKALQLGCTDTHFANPDGIYNENQYSTAEDIYKITRYAMNIPNFIDIVSKSECSVFGDERDPLITTNKMIDRKRGGEYYCPYVKGVKTGYIQEAGRCLASYAQKNDNTYIGVVMGGPVEDENGEKIDKNLAMIDTKNIYTWAFDNLKTIKLYPKNMPVAEVNLEYVWNHDKLLLTPDSDFSLNLPYFAKKEDVSIKVIAPNSVEAPVEKGETIGKAEVFYRDQKVGEFNVVSDSSFKKNYFMLVFKNLKKIVQSPLFKIALSIAVIFLIVYIFMIVKENKKRRKRNKIKKFPKNYR